MPTAIALDYAGAPGPQPLKAGDSSANSAVRVICVDDDNIILQLLGSSLQTMPGVTSLMFSNPADALRYLESDSTGIALMITDFRMPGLNGEELARAAHRLSPALPVICVTGFFAEGIPATEFVAVLEKPFEIARLQRLVRDHLSMAPA